jgi:hypothetical protein
MALSPSGIDGQGVTDYGAASTNVQLAAGMAGGMRHHHKKHHKKHH